MGSTKLAAFILLIFCLSQSVQAHCQSTPRVTLSEKNASLEKILNIIRKQTGFTYFGDAAWAQVALKVTISVTDVPIREALDLCFKGQPLSYELLGNAISIQIKGASARVLRGYLFNEKKEPVSGATILSEGSRQSSAISTDEGRFTILLHDRDTALLISSINYETQQIRIAGISDLSLQLKERISELPDASVVAHTGYQDIPRERATGSFAQLNTELIDRRVSTSILDRLEGVTSSLIFNKNITEGMNQSAITIRGRSTIFANPDPLVVVDNFPYGGDINNINPDDVESVTVLKDAAAASIWGAFSGNGVIVITTKKGKYGQKPKWSFNTSVTAGEKPDLYYLPQLSSKDYIGVETYLFDQHYYSQAETDIKHPAFSPVVELLIAERDGKISAADASSQIDALMGKDSRQDLGKYFYRASFNQQYSLNFSGGSPRDRYYVSAGYNRDLSNLVRNKYSRATLNASNTWSLLPKKKLELSTGLAFTGSTLQNNNNGVLNVTYPYAALAGSHGNALAIPYQLRQPYVDTVGGGQLLDWNYRPLDELHNANDHVRLTDTRINIGLRYSFLKGVDINMYYQYGHGSSDQKDLYSPQTYTARNLINRFSQPGMDGKIIRPVPLGGILDEQLNRYDANNVRLSLNYDHYFNQDNALNALAGAELRDVEGQVNTSRLYGYDPARHTSIPVNYSINYSQYYPPGGAAKIPDEDQYHTTSDRFLSYYANASYTYRHRYILSASARRDESNLFGVKANQRGVPLWSVGGAWEISKEHFYRVGWLPLLKLRVTNGYNGNVDRSVSAYTTAMINGILNDYGVLVSSITNPPNPALRWERINIFNAGLDFSTRNSRLGGSLEYYIKSGKDLIGRTPMDPTTGVLDFTGNTANMLAHGVDLVLHTNNITGPLKWNSDLLFSFVKDRVTRYATKFPSANAYFQSTQVSPVVGRPLYAIFSLKWMGLDPKNGDPLGYWNGHADTAYSTILGFPTDSLVYNGPANPNFFGSFRNTFSWRQFELSFNIIFKLGYYFRRNSINYSNLFSGFSKGHPDYERRWRKPGDEKSTYIPSLVDPAPTARDEFYALSEVLIEKGDHIRLQDIQLSYDLSKKSFTRLPLQAVRFYLYANNIGILWRANREGIDPDYINSIPNPRTLALGCKLDF